MQSAASGHVCRGCERIAFTTASHQGTTFGRADLLPIGCHHEGLLAPRDLLFDSFRNHLTIAPMSSLLSPPMLLPKNHFHILNRINVCRRLVTPDPHNPRET